VRLGGARLRVGDQRLALGVERPLDGEFEVRLLLLELSLALAEFTLLPPRLVQRVGLFLELIFEVGDVLRQLALGAPRRLGVCRARRLLELTAEFPLARRERRVELALERAFDLGAERLRQRNLLAAGRTGDRLLHAFPARPDQRGCCQCHGALASCGAVYEGVVTDRVLRRVFAPPPR
jgi:hypothetical protein